MNNACQQLRESNITTLRTFSAMNTNFTMYVLTGNGVIMYISLQSLAHCRHHKRVTLSRI